MSIVPVDKKEFTFVLASGKVNNKERADPRVSILFNNPNQIMINRTIELRKEIRLLKETLQMKDKEFENLEKLKTTIEYEKLKLEDLLNSSIIENENIQLKHELKHYNLEMCYLNYKPSTLIKCGNNLKLNKCMKPCKSIIKLLKEIGFNI